MRRFVRLLAAAVLAAGVMGGVMGGAMSSASAETRQSGTWVGAVERHGNHYDYVGRACPVEVDICIAAVVRYRIAPSSREAALALPRVAGGHARLEGYLIAYGDREHQGVLVVHRVTPAPGPVPSPV